MSLYPTIAVMLFTSLIGLYSTMSAPIISTEMFWIIFIIFFVFIFFCLANGWLAAKFGTKIRQKQGRSKVFCYFSLIFRREVDTCDRIPSLDYLSRSRHRGGFTYLLHILRSFPPLNGITSFTLGFPIKDRDRPRSRAKRPEITPVDNQPLKSGWKPIERGKMFAFCNKKTATTASVLR